MSDKITHLFIVEHFQSFH